jgi:hypothetical protein
VLLRYALEETLTAVPQLVLEVLDMQPYLPAVEAFVPLVISFVGSDPRLLASSDRDLRPVAGPDVREK